MHQQVVSRSPPGGHGPHGDGCREIIASCWDRLSPSVEHEDADANGWITDGAVYKLACDPIGLKDTGLRLPDFRDNTLVDIDGDGKPELV